MAASFGISPLTARAELESDPDFVLGIMDLRAMADAKAKVDRMDDDLGNDNDPHVALALEFLAEQLRERQKG